MTISLLSVLIIFLCCKWAKAEKRVRFLEIQLDERRKVKLKEGLKNFVARHGTRRRSIHPDGNS